MKARFIGKDGSMGFEHGKVYKIYTWVESKLFSRSGWLWVKDMDSNLYCPYSRLETFLNNWELLD